MPACILRASFYAGLSAAMSVQDNLQNNYINTKTPKFPVQDAWTAPIPQPQEQQNVLL